MNYSLSNMLGGGMVAGLDPDAKAYVNAVIATGISVTSTQRNAINDFIKAEKDASRYASIKRLYLPIWGTAAANAIDMVTRASGTFVNSPTHGAGFVQGNGSTSYFNFGVTPSALGLTTGDAGFYALIKQAGSVTGSRTYIGAADNPTNSISCWLAIAASGTLLSGNFGDTANPSAVITSPATHPTTSGIIAAFKKSGVATLHKRLASGNTVLATETESAAGTMPSARTLYAMASNYNGSPAALSDAQFGAFGASMGLDSASVVAFTANLKTLWETCTGLTLP